MSFTGDLEHLPIVDVIQLLHSTRKSGTLFVKGGRGESQLVFSEGYITSANHSNTSVRIGKILVDMQVITPELCDNALAEQKKDGVDRKPLIAILIERGHLKKEDAYKGLKSLIEMTVVEMLRWTRGTFTLDMEANIISDEYRYFPEMLHQEINLDTQRVLMDALRVFDEQNRDGGFEEEKWEEEATAATVETGSAAAAETEPETDAAGCELSADDLGLGELDHLETKIPEIFTSIEVVDPADIHRRKVADLIPKVAGDDRARLVDFLLSYSARPVEGEHSAQPASTGRALVFVSRDALARYVVMTLCKSLEVLIFTTDDEGDLDLILDQSLNKGMIPLLVFDLPDDSVAGWTQEDLIRLRRQKREIYPQVQTLQFAPVDNGDFSLQAYRDGARGVFPRPRLEDASMTGLIRFFETLRAYIKDYLAAHGPLSFGELREELASLQTLHEAQELSLALLQRVARCCERSLTFIVRPGELIAERGIGMGQDKNLGPSPPLKFKISLDAPSLLHKVLADGQLYYGGCDDEVIDTHLFSRIGAPLSK